MGARPSMEYGKYYSEQIFCPFDSISSRGMNPTIKFQAPRSFSPTKYQNQTTTYQKSSSTICSQPSSVRLQEEVQNYPACSVGFIQSWFGGNVWSTGSAFLIYKNIVMTCAHHLFDRQSNLIVKQVVFYPARIRSQGVKLKVKRVFYPKQYKEMEDARMRLLWDFGIMELGQNVHEQFGYLGISFDDSQIGVGYHKNILGYPKNSQGAEIFLYEGQCKLEGGVIKHNFPTLPGVDGGPILFETSKQVRVIGIHQGNYMQQGRGLKLRNQIYERIKFWLDEKRGRLSLSKMVIQRAGRHFYFQLEKLGLHRYQQKLVNAGLNNLGVAAVRMIISADWSNILSLNISENNIANSGLKLLTAGQWPKMTVLNLSCTCISSEGLQNLKNSNWGELESLNLSENDIRAEGVKHLVDCSWKKLSQLWLCGNSIGPKGGLQLSKSKWKYLERLELQHCDLQGEGVYWLTKADWKYLKFLNIAKNNVGDDGIKQLLDSHWIILEQLIIDQNKVTNQGFKSLTRLHWKNLRLISVRQNSINGLGLLSLCSSDWRRLEQVDCRWNKVFEDDIEPLRNALRICFQKLKSLDL